MIDRHMAIAFSAGAFAAGTGGKELAMATVTTLWTPQWHQCLFDWLTAAQRDVFLVSAWLRIAGAELILNGLLQNCVRPLTCLLTTLEEEDLVGRTRASDLEAYALLLRGGVEVRAVRGLHAKVYLFDDAQALVTSGNLTSRGSGRGGSYCSPAG
jgi:phosphatidylserine/phosphatidylglycerophosphate/cardiolipin synthase-like enzyme